MLLLMGPGTLGLAATQVNLFVNTLLPMGQGTGAVSWLRRLPVDVFPHRFLRRIDCNSGIARAWHALLMLNIPATFGLVVLSTLIVRLLFERGHFLPTDTASTAAALRFYAAGRVGYSTVRIVSRVFYAVGRSRVPVTVSAASIAVNIGASVTLVRVPGFTGLAPGTSIAAVTNGSLLLWLLRGELDDIEGSSLVSAFARIAAAGR